MFLSSEEGMFLSQEALVRFTGYKYPSKQLEYFKKRGYACEEDRYGRPVVLTSYIEALLNPSGANKKKKGTPDVQALRELMNVKTKNNK